MSNSKQTEFIQGHINVAAHSKVLLVLKIISSIGVFLKKLLLVKVRTIFSFEIKNIIDSVERVKIVFEYCKMN